MGGLAGSLRHPIYPPTSTTRDDLVIFIDFEIVDPPFPTIGAPQLFRHFVVGLVSFHVTVGHSLPPEGTAETRQVGIGVFAPDPICATI